jgi:hypothetical protein
LTVIAYNKPVYSTDATRMLANTKQEVVLENMPNSQKVISKPYLLIVVNKATQLGALNNQISCGKYSGNEEGSTAYSME